MFAIVNTWNNDIVLFQETIWDDITVRKIKGQWNGKIFHTADNRRKSLAIKYTDTICERICALQ